MTTATMPTNTPAPNSEKPKRQANQVQIMGTLTRDPELKYGPSGTPILSMSIANNNKYVDREKQEKEETCFVDVTVFGSLGEKLGQMLSRGSFIHVTGSLKQERWETEEGQKRSKHKITGFQVALYDKQTKLWDELSA